MRLLGRADVDTFRCLTGFRTADEGEASGDEMTIVSISGPGTAGIGAGKADGNRFFVTDCTFADTARSLVVRSLCFDADLALANRFPLTSPFARECTPLIA